MLVPLRASSGTHRVLQLCQPPLLIAVDLGLQLVELLLLQLGDSGSDSRHEVMQGLVQEHQAGVEELVHLHVEVLRMGGMRVLGRAFLDAPSSSCQC